MMKSNEESLNHSVKVLRDIEIFKDFSEESLVKICDLIMVVRVTCKLKLR